MIQGHGPPPSLVLALVQGLPHEGLTSALASGGYDFLGWGIAEYQNAEIYDAINTNTAATGNWKKGKAPKFQPFPRPKKDSDKAIKKPATVADIYSQFLARR